MSADVTFAPIKLGVGLFHHCAHFVRTRRIGLGEVQLVFLRRFGVTPGVEQRRGLVEDEAAIGIGAKPSSNALIASL